MNTVFSDDYVDELRRRWLSRPEQEWPLVARIGLLDARVDDRERIGCFVGGLHRDDQPKITKNLRSERQFLSAYGELLVGRVLTNAGLSPRYEAAIRTQSGLLTPDWYVSGTDPFICDAFEAGLDDQRNASETALREIEARLSEIDLGYMIRLEVGDAAASDPRSRKALATQFRHWLYAGRQKGDVFTSGNTTLEVLVVGGDRVTVLTSEPMHIVITPTKLRENFENKAKKYAPLGMPIVAAAVKHYRAEIDGEDVEDVLLGTATYVSAQSANGTPVEGWQRMRDGVFHSRPELSAAMWIEQLSTAEPVIQLWQSPASLRPLSPHVGNALAPTTS